MVSFRRVPAGPQRATSRIAQGLAQTLVCSKTRAMYERQCRQYNEDLASMAALRPLISETDGNVQTLRARMKAARQGRSPA